MRKAYVLVAKPHVFFSPNMKAHNPLTVDALWSTGKHSYFHGHHLLRGLHIHDPLQGRRPSQHVPRGRRAALLQIHGCFSGKPCSRCERRPRRVPRGAAPEHEDNRDAAEEDEKRAEDDVEDKQVPVGRAGDALEERQSPNLDLDVKILAQRLYCTRG